MNGTGTASDVPDGRFAGRRVLALGTFDSFIRTAGVIGRMFEAEGASLRFCALSAATKRGEEKAQLSTRQLRAGGVEGDLPVLSAASLVASRLFRDAHVVVAAIDGGRARELFLALSAADLSREPARPVIVVASPGVALHEQLAGYMSRAPADIVCFNAEGERAVYAAAADALGVDSTNAVTTGLLGLDRRQRKPKASARASIAFFEQPVIPALRAQRVYLVSALAELARKRPDVDVLVKLRHARGETAHHKTRHHLDDIADELGGAPKNLVFTHESAEKLLDRVSLAATVSSTVAVEAMARGVPTRVLSDFGVSEALGTAYFVGSGCLAPLASLDPGMADATDPAWLRERSGAAADPEALLSQCAALLKGQDMLGAALPLRPLTPAYGSAEWLDHALATGGPAAVHSPHLAERRRGGLVAKVAARLRGGRRGPKAKTAGG